MSHKRQISSITERKYQEKYINKDLQDKQAYVVFIFQKYINGMWMVLIIFIQDIVFLPNLRHSWLTLRD